MAFVFSSIPACDAGGNLYPAAIGKFGYYLHMNETRSQVCGFYMKQRTNTFTNADQCYLDYFTGDGINVYFPINMVDDGESCDNRVVGLPPCPQYDILSGYKTSGFTPTGRLELSGAVPGLYTVTIRVGKYSEPALCDRVINQLEHTLIGTQVFTAQIRLEESEFVADCSPVYADISFMFNQETNPDAPDWTEEGVSWELDSYSVSPVCMQ
jgi:hypothetical protein|nr:MAG TPA: hypothetical protein [Caudoviricetes sp.]